MQHNRICAEHAQLVGKRLGGGNRQLAAPGKLRKIGAHPGSVDVLERVVAILVVQKRRSLTEATKQGGRKRLAEPCQARTIKLVAPDGETDLELERRELSGGPEATRRRQGKWTSDVQAVLHGSHMASGPNLGHDPTPVLTVAERDAAHRHALDEDDVVARSQASHQVVAGVREPVPRIAGEAHKITGRVLMSCRRWRYSALRSRREVTPRGGHRLAIVSSAGPNPIATQKRTS